MATFDSFADAPERLRIEGMQITLRFDRTGPTTGRVSWNIPPPASGCTSETQAYCGMLVLLDTHPASIETAPVDGTQYTADPTADANLHAGDKVSTAMVIGAFYEGEKKGTGEDLTTFFDVSGLDSNTAYYVSGHAIDCEFRYHRQGVFAYSTELGNEGTDDTSGYQSVSLNNGDGVSGTDGTGLSLGQNYTLSIEIDGTSYEIVINGTDAQTYDDLIEALNGAIGQLTPAQNSPFPPNQNAYYWNATEQKLYQWNGNEHIEVNGSGSPKIYVLVEPTDPTALAIGDYWYDISDPENPVMSEWDGSMWNIVPNANIVEYSKSDLSDLDSDDYWYRNTTPSKAYQWCGNTWCELTLYDQTTDPSLGLTPNCGTYWYNPDDMLIRQWNKEICVWVETEAIYWNVDPNALTPTAFWFDDENEILYEWGTPISGIFNQVPYGFQDVELLASSPNSSFSLTDQALAVGEYTDDILINGNTYTVRIEICNETEGQFGNVFTAINEQLKTGSPEETVATVAFRSGSTNVIRITNTTASAPVIQAGGDLFSSLTDWSGNNASVSGTVTTVGAEPETPVMNQYWVDTANEKVFQWDGSVWDRQCAIFYDKDPSDRDSCDLWWNSDTDILYVWDSVNNEWNEVVNFLQTSDDPTAAVTLEIGSVWYNPDTELLQKWNGTEWAVLSFIIHPTDPTLPVAGNLFHNTTTDIWYEYTGGSPQLVQVNPIESVNNPTQSTLPMGTFWYDTMNNNLFMWNGMNWVSIGFSTAPLTPTTGDYWFNTTDNVLMQWNGEMWVIASLLAEFSLNGDGFLTFTSGTEGSLSSIRLTSDGLLESLSAFYKLLAAICGTDGLEGVPAYLQEGVGTDGSADERRQMDDIIRRHLGYPVVQVELDKRDVDLAIDIAIEELRRRSSPYFRGFMKLNVKPGQQRYLLTAKHPGYEQPDGSVVGYNKVVEVMGAYRVTSAFMSSGFGGGVFGQVVLQHLYNMGTFDLLSFHLVSEYIEQLEQLFASRVAFNWNEATRTLWLHQAYSRPESMLLDVAVERTEQDLLTDRTTRRWIEKYATAQSKMFLARIRGKYGSLPGAGGGIQLDAADLRQEATEEMEELVSQLDNFQVTRPEEFGNCEFTIG